MAKKSEATPTPADKEDTNPRIKHNARGVGAVRDARGRPVKGYNEIDPASQPRRTRITRKLDNPLCEVMVMERSRDGSAYRYRIQEIDDPSILVGAGATLFETEIGGRVHNAHLFRKILRQLRLVHAKALGLPPLMR